MPTVTPLRSGDYLVQMVDVRLPDNSVERVRVRAEIMQNMDIVTEQGVPNAGRTTSGSQGETAVIARVKLASLEGGVDSLGRPVSFTANTLPEGADCTLRSTHKITGCLREAYNAKNLARRGAARQLYVIIK